MAEEKLVTFEYKGPGGEASPTKVTTTYELAKSMGYTGADPNKKAAAPKTAATKKS